MGFGICPQHSVAKLQVAGLDYGFSTIVLLWVELTPALEAGRQRLAAFGVDTATWTPGGTLPRDL